MIGLQVTLTHFIVLSAVLFCIGLYGVLAKRNVVAILMCVELMFNSVNVALIAFLALSAGRCCGQRGPNRPGVRPVRHRRSGRRSGGGPGNDTGNLPLAPVGEHRRSELAEMVNRYVIGTTACPGLRSGINSGAGRRHQPPSPKQPQPRVAREKCSAGLVPR